MPLEDNPARLAADFHTLFNVVVALFPAAHPAAVALAVPLAAGEQGRRRPGPAAVSGCQRASTPSVALACAARETLHMGDIVETMLRESMQVLLGNDRKLALAVSQRDNAVDSLYEAIKLYVVQLTRDSLDEAEGRRAMEIMALSINLEHIGDIIDKNLMELANKKIKHQLQFSREGAQELEAFHRLIIDNLKLSFTVFLTGDVKAARQLLDEKPGCANWKCKPPKAIWRGCAKAGWKAWKPARCIWISCATSSAFTPICAPPPIRRWKPAASCAPAACANRRCPAQQHRTTAAAYTAPAAVCRGMLSRIVKVFARMARPTVDAGISVSLTHARMPPCALPLP
jgi:phosphate uptake regulator